MCMARGSMLGIERVPQLYPLSAPVWDEMRGKYRSQVDEDQNIRQK